MNKKIWLCGIVCGLTAAFCIGIGFLQYKNVPQQERYIDHIVNASADPGLGLTQIPQDRMVGTDFTSHLPLVVIDTAGNPIENYKVYNKETDSFDVPEGIDPYTSMTIAVYDSEDHVNRLSDTAGMVSQGRIKIRGNSSSGAHLPKFQYTVKLETEEGEDNPMNVMGIGTDDTWILSPTVRDISHIRNYLAFNIAGQIYAFQPDLRYCEVLFAENGQYRYGGIYMMCESINVSPDRVNIQKDSTKYHVGTGYLLSKDRYDEYGIMLDTYATRLGYYDTSTEDTVNRSFFQLEYPKNENATPEVIAAVTEEISYIEQLLFSDDINQLAKLEEYLDLESFADYVILNEYFGSYDAGMHSTYFYKDAAGKLTAGPFWDFDGAADNSSQDLADANKIVLPYYSWFQQLMRWNKFYNIFINRYQELRKTLLTYEYAEAFVADAHAYLGNALLRDESIFGFYTYDLRVYEEEETGLMIDRARDTPAAEAQRVLDFLYLHGLHMDKAFPNLEQEVVYYGNGLETNSALVVFVMLAFLVSTVLVRRHAQVR